MLSLDKKRSSSSYNVVRMAMKTFSVVKHVALKQSKAEMLRLYFSHKRVLITLHAEPGDGLVVPWYSVMETHLATDQVRGWHETFSLKIYFDQNVL